MLKEGCNTIFYESEFKRRASLALTWLKSSLLVNESQGSSAYYHLLKGWSPAYPETTGYLIPTLLDYDPIFPELQLQTLAQNCVKWLLSIQLENGTLKGGLQNSSPIVFDMAQILLGLTNMYQNFPSNQLKQAILTLYKALTSSMNEDGTWNKWNYTEAFTPLYYTRIMWPLILANQLLEIEHTNKLKDVLQKYLIRAKQSPGLEEWAFQPDAPAFTHTIAYTLRGFFEAGQLLENSVYQEFVIDQLNKLCIEFDHRGTLAGAYQGNWRGNYGFQCLTGNAQLSILYNKIYILTEDKKHLNMAEALFYPLLKKQFLWGPKGIRGGLPGSWPIWGPYQSLRIPNWGLKFFLDAYLALKQTIQPFNASV